VFHPEYFEKALVVTRERFFAQDECGPGSEVLCAGGVRCATSFLASKRSDWQGHTRDEPPLQGRDTLIAPRGKCFPGKPGRDTIISLNMAKKTRPWSTNQRVISKDSGETTPSRRLCQFWCSVDNGTDHPRLAKPLLDQRKSGS